MFLSALVTRGQQHVLVILHLLVMKKSTPQHLQSGGLIVRHIRSFVAAKGD